MGSKKRKTRRKGVSGNPQRRAAQLAAEQSAHRELPDIYEVGRRKRQPPPWWEQSHERVLAAARAAEWPTDLPGIETRTCEIAGDEFYERINADESGLDSMPWLALLAARAGTELRAAVDSDSPEWPRLWAFLQGLALIAPRQSPFAEDFDRVIARMEVPLDEDPFEMAQAETVRAARVLTGRGLIPDPGIDGLTVAYGAVAAGEPLFARDGYGSRFLVTAPFRYPGADGSDHWYGWDIDLCGNPWAVGAGTFGSAEDALAEWRDAAGPAASDSALGPCPESVYLTLLDSFTEARSGPELIDGSEQRDLVREFWRLRQRARAIAWGEGHAVDEMPALGDAYDWTPDYEGFLDWYAKRHSDVPGDLDLIAGAIIHCWGPREQPDATSFRACSPHRIEVAAVLIRDLFAAEGANQALRMLPEWTQWCLLWGELAPDSALAARALETARAEAAKLVTDPRADSAGDDRPFRRAE